jgi:predicted glycoside hydrolase/deacetylase ChbG (UPF0249 family)
MSHKGEQRPTPVGLVPEPVARGTKLPPNLLDREDLQPRGTETTESGVLILNADDWGRDRENTQRIHDCTRRGTVSSTSAMVFMEDSERAAALARETGVDAGLHLNFTTPYTAPNCPAQVLERQRELVSYLTRYALAQVVFHPGLARAFEYVVKAQLDEFTRLYGAPADRIDGHHHMHLCANVVFGKLLPAGTLVRRNFSFQPGEKSLANRMYRKAVDRRIARRHRMVDYLFSLPPLEPRGRLERIRLLARQHAVEVETHPINPDEYAFLTGGAANDWAGSVSIAARFSVPKATKSAGKGSS